MRDIEREMAIIEFAEQRLEEEIRQNDLGADNMDDIRYWVAYLDGAKAQKKEDDRNRTVDLDGEWMYIPLERYKEYKVKCPFCGAEYHDCYDGYISAEDFNYCPNCGAKMDGKGKEDE